MKNTSEAANENEWTDGWMDRQWVGAPLEEFAGGGLFAKRAEVKRPTDGWLSGELESSAS